MVGSNILLSMVVQRLVGILEFSQKRGASTVLCCASYDGESTDFFHFIYCLFNFVIFICFFSMVFISVELLFNVIVILFFQLI